MNQVLYWSLNTKSCEDVCQVESYDLGIEGFDLRLDEGDSLWDDALDDGCDLGELCTAGDGLEVMDCCILEDGQTYVIWLTSGSRTPDATAFTLATASRAV